MSWSCMPPRSRFGVMPFAEPNLLPPYLVRSERDTQSREIVGAGEAVRRVGVVVAAIAAVVYRPGIVERPPLRLASPDAYHSTPSVR